MAEGKKGVIVYADWIKKFESLADDEAGRLIKHFFRYINDQNPKPEDRMTELMFIDIELTLKRDLKLWEKRAERSRENGKTGGRPVKETQENPEEPRITQQVISKPRKPDTVKDTVTVKDNVIHISGEENEIDELKKKMICDSGLLMNWKQRGYDEKDFENGLDLFLSLKLHEKYPSFIKFRSNFIFWIPNYSKASEKSKVIVINSRPNIDDQLAKYK